LNDWPGDEDKPVKKIVGKVVSDSVEDSLQPRLNFGVVDDSLRVGAVADSMRTIAEEQPIQMEDQQDSLLPNSSRPVEEPLDFTSPRRMERIEFDIEDM
jgi:hypothetical protein